MKLVYSDYCPTYGKKLSKHIKINTTIVFNFVNHVVFI